VRKSAYIHKSSLGIGNPKNLQDSSLLTLGTRKIYLRKHLRNL
jgi:hypothetical protein